MSPWQQGGNDLRAEIKGGRKKKNKQGKSEQTASAIYTARHHLVGSEQHANNLLCETTGETPTAKSPKIKEVG